MYLSKLPGKHLDALRDEATAALLYSSSNRPEGAEAMLMIGLPHVPSASNSSQVSVNALVAEARDLAFGSTLTGDGVVFITLTAHSLTQHDTLSHILLPFRIPLLLVPHEQNNKSFLTFCLIGRAMLSLMKCREGRL